MLNFTVWVINRTPEEFVSAFGSCCKQCERISLTLLPVWSMEHTSSWKTNDWPYTADDFYPGDEYVGLGRRDCYASKVFPKRRVWQEKAGIMKFTLKQDTVPILL